MKPKSKMELNVSPRTVKISSGDLDAFDSPNMRPLVKAGIDFEVDYRAIHRPSRENSLSSSNNCKCHDSTTNPPR